MGAVLFHETFDFYRAGKANGDTMERTVLSRPDGGFEMRRTYHRRTGVDVIQSSVVDSTGRYVSGRSDTPARGYHRRTVVVGRTVRMTGSADHQLIESSDRLDLPTPRFIGRLNLWGWRVRPSHGEDDEGYFVRDGAGWGYGHASCTAWDPRTGTRVDDDGTIEWFDAGGDLVRIRYRDGNEYRRRASG